MAANDLVVHQHNDATLITGLLDIAEELKPYVGIAKKASHRLFVQNPDEEDIRHATMEQLMHGGKLIDGKHVKFAQDIVVIKTAAGSPIGGTIGLQAQIKRDMHDKKENVEGKDIPLADPRLQQIFEPQSEPDKEDAEKENTNTSRNTENMPTKRAYMSVTFDAHNVEARELAIKTCEAVDYVAQKATDELVKEARSYANTPFFKAMHDAKLDGNKIGLNSACKVEFGPDAHGIKEALMLLTKRDGAKPIEETPVTKMASKLAKTAAFRAPVERLLAGLAAQ